MGARNPEPVAIAILAKAPHPGAVKTRLIPALGAERAAALQAQFIARAAETALAANTGPVTLWAAPDRNDPALQRIAARFRLALLSQPEGDLGARMLAALAQPCGPALAIGTDCPALTCEHLRAAAEALRDGIDAVAIPVEDGGYAMIGTRRAEPSLFEDIAWSTPTVMAQTRRQLARLGLSWREPARLWDVDRTEDLDRLAHEGYGEFRGPRAI
jgi:rSAM/selenodomain-associated transferase 1